MSKLSAEAGAQTYLEQAMESSKGVFVPEKRIISLRSLPVEKHLSYNWCSQATTKSDCSFKYWFVIKSGETAKISLILEETWKKNCRKESKKML